MNSNLFVLMNIEVNLFGLGVVFAFIHAMKYYFIHVFFIHIISSNLLCIVQRFLCGHICVTSCCFKWQLKRNTKPYILAPQNSPKWKIYIKWRIYSVWSVLSKESVFICCCYLPQLPPQSTKCFFSPFFQIKINELTCRR